MTIAKDSSCNPSKGGLFRSGPILKGDGVVQNWLGHSIFERGSLALTIRRMPAFFETFPVLLIDQGGTVRADIPFRRAESRYSIEQTSVVIFFSRGLWLIHHFCYRFTLSAELLKKS